MLKASNLHFLERLKENNNREWFSNNKEAYLEEQQHLVEFADQLLVNLNKHDVIETPSGKRSLYRIYRDVRFSKDKTPYQTYWGGGFRRATKYRRGGYYFHIEKGNSSIAGGFWGPNKDDLKRVRTEIAANDTDFREVLSSQSFLQHFGTLQGEQLKVAPNGFDISHPAIDLLRYKQFLLIKRFSDEEVLSAEFISKVDETFIAMRPFFDLMSDILTTDANGTRF